MCFVGVEGKEKYVLIFFFRAGTREPTKEDRVGCSPQPMSKNNVSLSLVFLFSGKIKKHSCEFLLLSFPTKKKKSKNIHLLLFSS